MDLFIFIYLSFKIVLKDGRTWTGHTATLWVSARFTHITASPSDNGSYCHKFQDILCLEQMGLQNITQHISKEAFWFNTYSTFIAKPKLNKHTQTEFQFEAQCSALN